MEVDRDKVDDALDVTELSKSDGYEIEESEYVERPRNCMKRFRRWSS